MNLQEFVTASLTDILNGIIEAQRTAGIGGLIAPDGIGTHQFAKDSGVVHDQRVTSTVVKFDIAITVEQSKSGGGGAGIRIAVVEAKLGGEMQAKDTHVSRLQFSVPILMPLNQRNWAEERGSTRQTFVAS
jgi:hypothetical protein